MKDKTIWDPPVELVVSGHSVSHLFKANINFFKPHSQVNMLLLLSMTVIEISRSNNIHRTLRATHGTV